MPFANAVAVDTAVDGNTGQVAQFRRGRFGAGVVPDPVFAGIALDLSDKGRGCAGLLDSVSQTQASFGLPACQTGPNTQAAEHRARPNATGPDADTASVGRRNLQRAVRFFEAMGRGDETRIRRIVGKNSRLDHDG